MPFIFSEPVSQNTTPSNMQLQKFNISNNKSKFSFTNGGNQDFTSEAMNQPDD